MSYEKQIILIGISGGFLTVKNVKQFKNNIKSVKS